MGVALQIIREGDGCRAGLIGHCGTVRSFPLWLGERSTRQKLDSYIFM